MDGQTDVYRLYYSADIMRLVVLGRESLDELQKLVIPKFEPVPLVPHPPPLFKPDARPFPPSAGGAAGPHPGAPGGDSTAAAAVVPPKRAVTIDGPTRGRKRES